MDKIDKSEIKNFELKYFGCLILLAALVAGLAYAVWDYTNALKIMNANAEKLQCNAYCGSCWTELNMRRASTIRVPGNYGNITQVINP